MDNFKKTVADNLIRLRTRANMTQAQLGEALNYSDKSVSKWERAESLPDAYVLKQIADVFDVSVDYILSEHSDDDKVPTKRIFHRYSRSVITTIAFIGVWTVALLAFIISWIYGNPLWILFVYTAPVSLTVLLVLNSIWGNAHSNMYIISGIAWGLLTSVYLSFLSKNWWQLFLIGLPVQIIIILCFYIKNNRKSK